MDQRAVLRLDQHRERHVAVERDLGRSGHARASQIAEIGGRHRAHLAALGNAALYRDIHRFDVGDLLRRGRRCRNAQTERHAHRRTGEAQTRRPEKSICKADRKCCVLRAPWRCANPIIRRCTHETIDPRATQGTQATGLRMARAAPPGAHNPQLPVHR
jgi:hypothetical protein